MSQYIAAEKSYVDEELGFLQENVQDCFEIESTHYEHLVQENDLRKAEITELQKSETQLKSDLAQANTVIDLLVEASEGTIMYDDIQTNFAKEVSVPSKSLSTAKVNMIGGMSRKCRNLFDKERGNETIGGITVTKNADNTYTLNGTATGLVEFNFPMIELNAGTYKVVGTPSGGDFYGGYSSYIHTNDWSINQPDEGSGTVLSLSNTTILQYAFVFRPNVTVNNLIFKPMITTDTSLNYDSYEPYTSSLIDAPVDGVVTSGLNLFPYEPQTFDNFSCNFVLKKGTYAVNVFDKADQSNITFQSNGANVIRFGWWENTGVVNVAEDVIVDKVSYDGRNVVKIMIVNGNNIPTEFVVGKPPVTTPIPTAITELPDWGKGVNEQVYNYVDLESGKYYHKLKRNTKTTFDADIYMGNALYDGTGYYVYCSNKGIGAKDNGYALCSKFTYNRDKSHSMWEELTFGEFMLYETDYIVFTWKNNNLQEFLDYIADMELYYETETTEVIDVEPMTMYIPVEANGKVQMHYPNCDVYDVNVPSTITFPCKLGGN